MKRKFTKIKYNQDKAELYFSFSANNGNEYTVKARELPLPSFILAMRELDQYVIEICELPVAYHDRITTRSVSLNYQEESEIMGATLTAQMKLYNSNCPLNLNTPNKPESPYNQAAEWDEVTCLPQDCVDAIHVLCDEADKYLDGHIAQGELFTKEDEVEVSALPGETKLLTA